MHKRKSAEVISQYTPCTDDYDNAILDNDEPTNILNEANQEEAVNEGEQVQNDNDDGQEIQDAQDTDQHLPRRSSRDRDIPSNLKDYVYTSLGRGMQQKAQIQVMLLLQP